MFLLAITGLGVAVSSFQENHPRPRVVANDQSLRFAEVTARPFVNPLRCAPALPGAHDGFEHGRAQLWHERAGGSAYLRHGGHDRGPGRSGDVEVA